MTFQKGQSGNPSGKRKDKLMHDALRLEITRLKHDDPRSARSIAQKLLELAAAGEPWAMREVFDRLDGKPAQSVDVNTEFTKTMVIRAPEVAESTEAWLEQVKRRQLHRQN